MKRLSVCLFAILVLGSVGASAQGPAPELSGTLTLSGAWAIYPTVVAWGEAFQKSHPKVRVDISAGGAGKGAADAISGLVDIGMVSREPDPSEIQRGIFPVLVLHDAVFAVVSDKNPLLKDLLKKGVKRQALVDLYIGGTLTSWDGLVGRNTGRPVHLYTRSDSCGAAASWAGYLGKKQEDLRGVGIFGDPGILEAVKRDPVGIGFSNFSYVFDREGKVLSGLVLVPIDANENGTADPDEVFTARLAAAKAIESKAYPVSRNNYLFVKGKPRGLARDFIVFALSDEGTKVVEAVGTSLALPKTARQEELKRIQ